MKPHFGTFVRSMRPSQRRALGGLLAVLVLSTLYTGSYAVLRLSDYLVRHNSREYGESMFGGFGRDKVLYTRGRYEMWGDVRNSGSTLRILRFFMPMIRIEGALRDAISRIP